MAGIKHFALLELSFPECCSKLRGLFMRVPYLRKMRRRRGLPDRRWEWLQRHVRQSVVPGTLVHVRVGKTRSAFEHVLPAFKPSCINS